MKNLSANYLPNFRGTDPLFLHIMSLRVTIEGGVFGTFCFRDWLLSIGIRILFPRVISK